MDFFLLVGVICTLRALWEMIKTWEEVEIPQNGTSDAEIQQVNDVKYEDDVPDLETAAEVDSEQLLSKERPEVLHSSCEKPEKPATSTSYPLFGRPKLLNRAEQCAKICGHYRFRYTSSVMFTIYFAEKYLNVLFDESQAKTPRQKAIFREILTGLRSVQSMTIPISEDGVDFFPRMDSFLENLLLQLLEQDDALSLREEAPVTDSGAKEEILIKKKKRSFGKRLKTRFRLDRKGDRLQSENSKLENEMDPDLHEQKQPEKKKGKFRRFISCCFSPQ